MNKVSQTYIVHALVQRSVALAQHRSVTGSTSCACMTVHELFHKPVWYPSKCETSARSWSSDGPEFVVLFRHASSTCSGCPTFVLYGADILKMRFTRTATCAATKINNSTIWRQKNSSWHKKNNPSLYFWIQKINPSGLKRTDEAL